ncbi:MAG: tetratricopeptide repeat protein [Planctomycetota bacterium]
MSGSVSNQRSVTSDLRSSVGRIATLLLVVVTLAGCHSSRSMTKHETPQTGVTPGKLLATATQSRTAEACRRTGLELAQHNRDEHAIEQLEKAREINPRIKGVSHPLAVLFDRQGRFDAADREYQRALDESPRSADLLSDYGYFLYSRGNVEQAEERLRAAIKADSGHEKALLNLGLVLGQQQQFDEALTVFERAVGPAAARHNLGLLHAQHGNTDEASRWFAEAARLDPSLTQPRDVLAWMEPNARPSDETILPASYEE